MAKSDSTGPHQDQWLKLAKQIQSQLSPMFENLRSIAERTTELTTTVSSITAQMKVSIDFPKLDLSNLVPKDLGLAPLPISGFSGLADTIMQSLQPFVEQLRESFKDLPPKAQEALSTLGAHGWYLDLHMGMGELFELSDALERGDIAESEGLLCSYFETRLNLCESEIGRRFPQRQPILGEAFAAHRNGQYFVSIPVMLAQVDGICREVTNQYFFIKREGKPQTAAYVEQIASDSLQAALLSPLAMVLPINASEKSLPPNSEALNRHEVLHGVSLEYGSRLNALKSVSLLNYVAMVLRDSEPTDP